jgi:hypothetical protein
VGVSAYHIQAVRYGIQLQSCEQCDERSPSIKEENVLTNEQDFFLRNILRPGFSLMPNLKN